MLDQLQVWDVIFPHDDLIYPPKFKMWVCVSRHNMWFLRINSEPITPPCVELKKSLHPFLEHDSWLGCGGDLVEIMEMELEEALERQRMPARQGIVGRVAPDVDLRRRIVEGIEASPRLSPAQKEAIMEELARSLEL